MNDETISSQAQRCFDEDFRKMLEKDGELDSDEDEALDSEDNNKKAWSATKTTEQHEKSRNFMLDILRRVPFVNK